MHICMFLIKTYYLTGYEIKMHCYFLVLLIAKYVKFTLVNTPDYELDI